jgi:hypothetical protein
MEFDAITIDTQVVETNGFDFDGGLLAQLKQFKNGPTKVIISNVVASEILKHLREKTLSAKDSAETAHRKSVLYGLKPKGDLLFPAELDINALTRQRLSDYFTAIGAKIVGSDDVLVPDLLKMYFAATPPFSNSPKKKSEFPDAIALMSLEKWAAENDVKLLAVSGDGDWLAYKGERVTPVDNLAAALAKLQTGAGQADDIVRQVLTEIAANARPEMFTQLEGSLESGLVDYLVTAQADSSLELEDEGVSLTLNALMLQGDEAITLVQVGPNKIVFKVEFEINVKAEASFAMFVYADKDMIPMGSTSATRDDVDLMIQVLVTLEGDFRTDEIYVAGVEIISPGDEIHFGYVEPDFRDDPYENEWEDDVEPEEPELEEPELEELELEELEPDEPEEREPEEREPEELEPEERD